MAIGQQYISVRNWREFQHYDPAKRTPPWIKNYTGLLHDDAYLELPEGTRAVLHGIWLEYASSRCRLALDTGSLTRRLNMRVTTRQLERLVDAGFITIVASAVLAEGYQRATTEVEVEIERSSIGEDLLLSAPNATTHVANGSSPTTNKATRQAETLIRNGGHGLTTYSLDDELERLSVPTSDRPRLRAMAEELKAATTEHAWPTNAGELEA